MRVNLVLVPRARIICSLSPVACRVQAELGVQEPVQRVLDDETSTASATMSYQPVMCTREQAAELVEDRPSRRAAGVLLLPMTRRLTV